MQAARVNGEVVDQLGRAFDADSTALETSEGEASLTRQSWSPEAGFRTGMEVVEEPGWKEPLIKRLVWKLKRKNDLNVRDFILDFFFFYYLNKQ